jgi:hypothetical protein
MDFSATVENQYDIDISISRAASEYIDIFNGMLRI